MADELTQAVQQHGPALYRIAWRILRQAEEVDDVLQDFDLEAIKLARREPVKSWQALLKRLTVCRSLDRLRKRRPAECFQESDSPMTGRFGLPVENAIANEVESRLRQTIGRLPERQAEVFSLRFFDECSNQEIAATLQISTAAVATALRKSRLRLSELLSTKLERGEK